MKFRLKLTFLALATGVVVLQAGACFFRYLGDLVGDTIVLRNID